MYKNISKDSNSLNFEVADNYKIPSYLNIVGGNVVRNKETPDNVGVILNARQLPNTLAFNKSETADNSLEYSWEIRIRDKNATYSLLATHYKKTGSSEAIEEPNYNVTTKVYKILNDGTYVPVETADDPTFDYVPFANVITLGATIKDLDWDSINNIKVITKGENSGDYIDIPF